MMTSWRLGMLAVLAASCELAAADKPAVQDVCFTAEFDKTQQRYMMILPAGFQADRTHDLLVALHGHGSDRRQFASDKRSECQAARDVAAKRGMIFVSPDYRAPASWMNAAAEADVAQIIADLKKQYRVGKVFLTGGSMGGLGCLAFAARRPELVDGVASMNGTANLLEYDNPTFLPAIARSYGGTKVQIPAEWKARSAEYWPERLTMAVGLTTGGKDTAVTPDSVIRLAGVLKKLGRPVLLIRRETGGHSTNLEDATAILEFVIEKAKASGGPSSRPGGGISGDP